MLPYRVADQVNVRVAKAMKMSVPSTRIYPVVDQRLYIMQYVVYPSSATERRIKDVIRQLRTEGWIDSQLVYLTSNQVYAIILPLKNKSTLDGARKSSAVL